MIRIGVTHGSNDVNRVYRDYYDLLRQSAKSGLFVLWGVDLVKIWPSYCLDAVDEASQAARVFECGWQLKLIRRLAQTM